MKSMVAGVIAVSSIGAAACSIGSTVDQDLFAHSENETSRRVAVAVPTGTPETEVAPLMTKHGWACRDNSGFGVTGPKGEILRGPSILCDASPGFGGGFHSKQYIAKFLFRDGKVFARDVYMIDPGI